MKKRIVQHAAIAETTTDPESKFRFKRWKEGPEVTALGVVAPSAKSPSASCCSGNRTEPARLEGNLDDFNAIVMEDMRGLSFKERIETMEEVHGVQADTVVETKEFLDQKLDKMQKGLNSTFVKPAYNLAKLLSPSIVEDRELRLMMLRAERYQPAKAAKRLVSYFSMKLNIFGVGKLAKEPITQDDLDENMKKRLRSGIYQISRKKDRSGRSVMVFKVDLETDDWRTHLGMCWYLQMEALRRDPENQTKGFVGVFVIDAKIKPGSLETLKQSARFTESLPFRQVALHLCYSHRRSKPGMNFVHSNLSKLIRLRLRGHYGSPMECLYELGSFGLTRDIIPIDEDGNMKTKEWNLWLDELQSAECAVAATSTIVYPKRDDVLLGRGRGFQEFPGNIFLADLVERNRSNYAGSDRDFKRDMTMAVTDYIRRVRGGRFLRRVTEADGDVAGHWIEVIASEARKKTSHSFRVLVRRDPPADEVLGEFKHDATNIVLLIPASVKIN